MLKQNKVRFQIIIFIDYKSNKTFETETHEYEAETPGSIVKQYTADHPIIEKKAYKMLVLNTVSGIEYKFERFAGGWNIIG